MTAAAPNRAAARRVLAATCVSYTLVLLDASIVNVALTDIAHTFGSRVAGLQWIVNAYTLAFASLLMTGGTLGDRLGDRTVYVAGLAVFVAASALCSLAPTLPALAIARALQGVGSAMLVPCSLALIHRAFPEPAARASAISVWMGCGGIAMASGPLIGGLLLDINALGLPASTEFLDLLSPQYIADLIAWGAIGARTTESQSHRQLASGLSCPIGFKNGTDGGVQVASDAIVAAAASHAFMGMTKMGMAAIFETRGNDDAHVILRGGKNGPNYDAAHVEECCAVLRKAGLREQVMVDCSHANSNKSHERQIEVAQDLARQLSQGEHRIVGVMVESHLEAGRQDLKPGVPLKYGVSITDACLSWTQTEPVLDVLAEAVRHRRVYSRNA